MDTDEKKSHDNKPNTSKNHYTNNSTVRQHRNEAEKIRRDKLNAQITQLAKIVPTVINATKPLDKVSILRLTASWMRLNYSCLNAKRFKSVVKNYLDIHHSVISNLDIIEKSINGFIIATTFDGIILMCSRYAEDHIGYQNIDLLDNHISNYILNKERELFKKKMRNLVSKFKNGSTKKLRNVIRAHMQQRPLPRSNDVRYRKMSFSLTIHSGTSKPSECNVSKKNPKVGQRKDFGENAVILIFVEPIQEEPDIDLKYLEQKDCYFTVHGPQGEIIFADHRISIMTGYMPCDVLGHSAYQYIHASDVPIALFAQKTMFASNDGTGIITYRLRIQDSNFIYLQSKGQIRYKDSSKEIRQFICCNMLLNDEDGHRELKKFQDRFAPQLAASENAKFNAVTSKAESPKIFKENPTVINKNSKILEVDNFDKSKDVYVIKNGHSNDDTIDTELDNSPSSGSVNNLQAKCELKKKINQHSFNIANSVTSQSDYVAEPLTMADAFEASTEVQNPINNKVQAICNDVFSNFQSSCHFNTLQQNCDNFNSLQLLSPSLSNEFCLSSPNIQKSLENNDFHQLKNGYKNSLKLANGKYESLNFLSSDLFHNSGLMSETSSFEENDDQLVFDKHLSNSRLQKRNFMEMGVANSQNSCLENNMELGTNSFSKPQTTFQNHQSFQQNCFIPNKTYSTSENMHNFDFITDVVRDTSFPSDLTTNGVDTFSSYTLSPSLSDNMSQGQSMTPLNDNSTCNVVGESEMVSQHNLDLIFLDQTVDELSLLNDLNGSAKNTISLQYEASYDDNLYGAISNHFPSQSNLQNGCNYNNSNSAFLPVSPLLTMANYSNHTQPKYTKPEAHSSYTNPSSLQASMANKQNNPLTNRYNFDSGDLGQLLRVKKTENTANVDQLINHQVDRNINLFKSRLPNNIVGTENGKFEGYYSEMDINSKVTPLNNCPQNHYITSNASLPGSSQSSMLPFYQIKLDKYSGFSVPEEGQTLK